MISDGDWIRALNTMTIDEYWDTVMALVGSYA